MEDKVEKLAYELQNLGIKRNQIYAKLNTLLSEKRKEDGLIDVWREREYYRDFPTCEEEMSGFGKAFRELTDGLDAESIRTIVLAINRMRKIKSSKDQRMSLYTAREEQEYREILEQMNGEILLVFLSQSRLKGEVTLR